MDMQVRDVMTRNVIAMSADETLVKGRAINATELNQSTL
jgi:hypothetical protein